MSSLNCELQMKETLNTSVLHTSDPNAVPMPASGPQVQLTRVHRPVGKPAPIVHTNTSSMVDGGRWEHGDAQLLSMVR
eukprot:46505-Eustigmatos_ZCMA.PRE.1